MDSEFLDRNQTITRLSKAVQVVFRIENINERGKFSLGSSWHATHQPSDRFSITPANGQALERGVPGLIKN